MTQRANLVITIDSREAERRSQALERELSSIQRTGDFATKSMDSMSVATRKLAAHIAGLATVGAAVAKIDAYTNMNNRLKLVTNSQSELNQAMSDTFKIAQNSRAAWDGVIQVYQRFSDNAKMLGIDMKKTAELTDTVSKAVAISGASAQAAEAALTQLGQSIASNRFSGEEFNSVAEQTPALLKAIANGLGVNIGELRSMSQEGKITGEVLVKALSNAKSSVDELFSKTDMTIGQSLTYLNNEITKFVGEAGKGSGAATTMASSVKVLADNLSLIADVSMLGGVAFLTKAILAKSDAVRLGIADTLASRQASLANAQAEVAEATATLNAAKAHLANVSATNAEAQAKYGATAANARYAAALEAVTIATNAQTAAQGRLSAASLSFSRLASGAFNLIGGPIGAITLGVTGLAAGYMYLQHRTEEANKKLEEQGRVADKTREELLKLQGVERKSATNDLTAAFEAKNKALEKSRLAVGSALIDIQNYEKGKWKVIEVINKANKGTISYSDAIKQLNGMKISPDLYNALKKQVEQYDANYDKANKSATALKIFGIEVKLAGSAAQNAAIQHQKQAEALGGTEAAADRIYNEALGISWAITEKSCKEAIDELLYHIEAGIRVNRQTGQYEIILFRDDALNLGGVQKFNKSNIKSFNAEIPNADELINSLNVNFYDRANIKNSSFTVDENGSIMSSEARIQTVDFPYFMNRRDAELVANWKLKQLSTPTWKGSFTTGKYEARKINRYDVIKVTWENLGIIELPVRVMKISLGDGKDNTVTIDFVEVIPYSNLEYPRISIDPLTNPILPPQPNLSTVFEVPYFEAVQRLGQTQVDAELLNNPDLGYLMVATKKPQNNSLNALLYTNASIDYKQASVVDYCPTCALDQDIVYLDTSFAVKDVDSIEQAEIGTLILCEDELLVYQSYDAETKILTVKRGALDTIPKLHSVNAAFYFYDAFNAFDSEQYVLSEVISAKVLTTTPSGIQELSDASEMSLEINARPIRPYPPANIKVNNTYFIETIVVSNDVVVTWVDRNRVQQTGGSILGWTDGGVVKETGVTYSIELSSENVVLASASGITANTYTINHSVLKPNKVHKLRLWSVRDGYECYQVFEHNFFGEAVSLILTATASKDKVIGSTVPTANITVVVDESLKANMKYDGSSISGKSLPNSTITIEVDE